METRNECFLNSQGQSIRYAQYKDQLVAEYQGNPLIEALPPILSYEDAVERLISYPSVSQSERLAPSHIRFHMIMRLTRFFQPWDIHIDLEQKFSAIIRQGYISRNPLGPGYAKDFRLIHQTIEKKELLRESTPYIPSSATTLSVIGVSGVGKTSSVERVLSLYPQVICHQTYDQHPFNQYQVTWIKLECPHDGSINALCSRFFGELDRLLDENFSEKYGQLTTPRMISKMETLTHRHHLGVLVIDEIQHLLNAKYTSSNQMMDFFTSLVNLVRIPIVLIGTNKAVDLLRNSLRHARRATGSLGVVYFEALPRGSVWDLLMEGLWSFQWTAEESELTDEIREAFYDHCQGIIDIAVKLYIGAQTLAIKTGLECITADLIHLVAEQYQIFLKEIVDTLREQDPDKMSRYDDIMPPDVQRFLDKLAHDTDFLKTRLQNRTHPRKQTATKETVVLPPIAPARTEISEEDDLRRIAETAKKSESSIYDALNHERFIKDSHKDLL